MASALDAVVQLQELPWTMLPASFRVDVLQLVSGARPALRTRVTNGRARRALQAWAGNSDCDYAEDGAWVCVASSGVWPRRVLEIDARPEPHVYDLGMLLGYPECCCAAASITGEEHLDELAMAQAEWPFDEKFKCLDTRGYSSGRALISHLPCQSRCRPSRRLAMAAVKFAALVQADSEPYNSWQHASALLWSQGTATESSDGASGDGDELRVADALE